jgi:hypothetical protein
MPRRPLPIIADIFRVTLNWEDTGAGKAHNVLHFSAPGKTESDVFTTIDAHVTQQMWDWAATTEVVESVSVLPLDGSSATTVHLTGSPAKWTGGGTGQPLPQVCGIIKLETGLRGPANRGRVFIPHVGEGETAVGALSDITTVSTAWVAFANAMATAGVALGVASYKNVDWHQAINVGGGSRTATQRRRQHR